MIGALCAIALVIALGLPAALLLDRKSRNGALVAEAFLLGIAIAGAILLAYSVVHARWSRAALLIGAAVAGAALWFFARARRDRFDFAFAPSLSWFFGAACAVSLVGYSMLATLAPPWEIDYINDWGLKARVFFEARDIDWTFLQHSVNRVVHPDYPPLLPFAIDLFALVRGAWDDRWFGAINVCFATAMLLFVQREMFEETRSKLAAAFAAFAILPFAQSPWIGIADGPLAAYVLVALLLLRRAVNADDARDVSVGAVMLGLAASTKNEGLTFIVAAALGLLAAGRARWLARLWPALAIPLPWLVLRALHTLPTDIAEGNVVTRALAHLRQIDVLLEVLTRYPVGKPLFWIALLVGLLVNLRVLLARERVVLTAVAFQFACYIGAYVVTPHDVNWHVKWSWERLITHISAPLAYVILAAILTSVTAAAAPAPGRSERPLRG